MRRLAGRSLLVLGGVLLPLVVLECVLQAGHYWIARRTPLDRVLHEERDGLSVLCLGDSHTFGVYFPAELSYPARLQSCLDRALGNDRVRVVRAALPGMSTAGLLRELPGLLERHQPAIVLVLAGLNNRWNEDVGGDREGPRSGFWTRLRLWRLLSVWSAQHADNAGSPLLDGDEVTGLMARRFGEAVNLPDDALSRSIVTDLREIVARCRDRNALPVLLTYAPPDPPFTVPDAAIRQVATELRVGLVDLEQVFQGALQETPYEELFIPGDFHLRPAGYEIVARTVAARIVQLLPEAPQGTLDSSPPLAGPGLSVSVVENGVLRVQGPPFREFRVFLSQTQEPRVRFPRAELPLGADSLFLQTRDLPELGGHLDERGGAEVRLDLAGVPPGGLPLLAVAALLRPSDPTVKLEYRVEAVSGVLELRLLGAP